MGNCIFYKSCSDYPSAFKLASMRCHLSLTAVSAPAGRSLFSGLVIIRGDDRSRRLSALRAARAEHLHRVLMDAHPALWFTSWGPRSPPRGGEVPGSTGSRSTQQIPHRGSRSYPVTTRLLSGILTGQSQKDLFPACISTHVRTQTCTHAHACTNTHTHTHTHILNLPSQNQLFFSGKKYWGLFSP